MKPWSYEGGDFIPDESSEDFIYTNEKMKKFLTVGEHETYFFLIGPKGIGKTLLIRYKAYKYWSTGKYPSRIRTASDGKSYRNDLVENIQLGLNNLTTKEISKFKFNAPETWRKVWKFSLMYYFVCRYQSAEMEANKHLQVIKTKNSVSSIATEILSALNRPQLEKIYQLEAEIFDLVQSINLPVVLFLDRLDQNLSEYVDTTNGHDPLCVGLWNAAQVGLTEAIYDIYSTNPHIKVFTTIRSEAFIPELFAGGLYQNISEYTTKLTYTKDEVRTIFLRNISLMDKRDLCDPANTDPISSFVGFDDMEHRFAKDIANNRRVENTFDFIYRHTFGRPREIVRQGREISDIISRVGYKQLPPNEKVELVRETVNNVAYDDLLRPYIQEIIPPFRQREFEEFCRRFSCNVITEKEIRAYGNLDFANYLYKMGLLGYIEVHQKKDTDESYGIQQFKNAGEYLFDPNNNLPRSSFYMTHPTIDRQFLEHTYTRPFYNQYNIIGNTYKFDYLELSHKRPFDTKLFHPKKIPTQRWDMKGDGMAEPIKAYYEYLDQLDAGKLTEYFDIQMLRCYAALKVLGEITFLSQYSLNDAIQLKINEFKSSGGAYSEYSAYLGTPSEEGILELFINRLIGRCITAGATLLYNCPVKVIHGILSVSDYSFGDETATSSDSCLRFLRKCFFIEGLTQKSFQNSQEKNTIFEFLSEFEQETINKVRRDHVQNLNDLQAELRFKKNIVDQYLNQLFIPSRY